jgi:threonine dehydratase
MSRLVPDNKVSSIRSLGAEVLIVGDSQDDAHGEVLRLISEQGLTMISPFDDQAVIAGQGTLGLEIVEAVPEVELVLVPLSGGGLASGIAVAIKTVQPKTRVVGVSMERGAAMKASIEAGRPVLVTELPTLADALGGGIGPENRFTLSLCRDLLDDVMLLTEAEIAAGICYAYEMEKEVVEGAGVVGIAALLAGKANAHGPAIAILSGRNIDMGLHRRIITTNMHSLEATS